MVVIGKNKSQKEMDGPKEPRMSWPKLVGPKNGPTVRKKEAGPLGVSSFLCHRISCSGCTAPGVALPGEYVLVVPIARAQGLMHRDHV